MKAFIVDQYGKTSTVRAGQVPEPEVGDSDVLVRIRAAGVNPLDSKIMTGEFKLVLPYRTPFVLGNDLAGVVERVGRSVRKFAPGAIRPVVDRVFDFADTAAALDHVGSGRVKGKVVVSMTPAREDITEGART